ncbi:MAG: L,D-transpeptidase [Solirubrobacteraceae bacterium]|nr:L,D-transpeptidase [Solirubrobacteraceae bacterium]
MRRHAGTAAAAALLTVSYGAAPAYATGDQTVVRIQHDAPLHATPGGTVLRAAGAPIYERGSAWVVRRRGDWLQIPSVQRRSGALGWVRKTSSQRLTSTRMRIRVDLSDRRMWVMDGTRRVMSAPVAIGAQRTPSPVGSTSVSGRIAVTPSSAYSARAYGPVIVALRMWQSRPSPGMPFGGVMAFHGGADEGSVGTAISAGCFRMRNADVLRLARIVRAGTPVIVSR